MSVTSLDIITPLVVKGGTSVPSLLRTATSSIALPTDTVALRPFFLPTFTAPANAFPVTLYPSDLPSPIAAVSTFFDSLSDYVTFDAVSVPSLDSAFSDPGEGTGPEPPTTPTPNISLGLFPTCSSARSTCYLVVLSVYTFSYSYAPFYFPGVCARPYSIRDKLMASRTVLG